jgi:hypothetical protein
VDLLILIKLLKEIFTLFSQEGPKKPPGMVLEWRNGRISNFKDISHADEQLVGIQLRGEMTSNG